MQCGVCDQLFTAVAMAATTAAIVRSCILWTFMVQPLYTDPHPDPQCDHHSNCGNYPPSSGYPAPSYPAPVSLYPAPRPTFTFTPSPPGKAPPCAKPGTTYCESIHGYPTQLIHYLIEKWGYNYATLFSDETRENFNSRKPAPYGPPVHPGYRYSAQENSYFPAVQLVGNVSNGGYPDRQYRLPPEAISLVPFAYPPHLQAPVHLIPGSFWERHARSIDDESVNKNQHSRKKRQAGRANTLCPTRTNFIMPKAAMNKNGNWMYVVNLKEVDNRFTQLVATETCITNQCSGLCSIPNGYSSRCEQQYVQKRLVALEPGGDQLYTDVFWFPHCCICQFNRNNG